MKKESDDKVRLGKVRLEKVRPKTRKLEGIPGRSIRPERVKLEKNLKN